MRPIIDNGCAQNDYKRARKMRLFLDAMNRKSEKLFECPVCGVGVTFHVLHEHYATHFHNESSSEPIKVERSNARSFLLSPTASVELQQTQQKQQKQVNDNVEASG